MATKVIPIKPLTAWSFSRYSTYNQCPAKLKYTAVDKLKEPKAAAMERGTMIHSLAEGYIKGTLPAKLPVELIKFEKEFKMLRKQYKKKVNAMVVEDSWAFCKDWSESTWNDWVNCYLRIKLDCAHHENDTTLVITDWKTGKFREDSNEEYCEQLELYALASLLLHDHIMTVLPRLVYLDHGVIYPRAEKPLIFTRADIPRLKKLWEKRVKPMMTDTIFAPRPNRFCSWCHFRKDNAAKGGGQCKY